MGDTSAYQVEFYCEGPADHPHRRRHFGPAIEAADGNQAIMDTMRGFGFTDEDVGNLADFSTPARRGRWSGTGERIYSANDDVQIAEGQHGPVWIFTCRSCDPTREVRAREVHVRTVVRTVLDGGDTRILNIARWPR